MNTTKFHLCWVLLCANSVAYAACAITLPAGSSASTINSALAGNKRVCLSAGTYVMGATQITVPFGKTLEGLGATRGDVVINSSASRAISLGELGTLRNFTLSGPGTATAEYGVAVYNSPDSIIWDLDVHGFYINIGINGSPRTHVWGTLVSMNGVTTNSIAEPNIWINNSSSTEIIYGAVYGRGNKPFGDGEVSCYSSSDLRIEGVYSFDSGTSAFYLVDCDNAVIENASIYRAGGFGLDIMDGSDNFQSINNLISQSWYAGSVYDNVHNSNGVYQGTTFTNNNLSGDVRFCSGIYLSSVGVGNYPATTGTTATPGPVICP